MSDTVYPLVTLTQTVPTVVLAPLLILWAGFGLLPKVVLVALTAFFPVLVAAVTAMAAVDAEHAEMVAGLGGTRRHQFWLVQLPASVPGALGGLRVAATYAIGAAVVAEYLAGQSGLGVFVQRSRKGYEVDQILVAVALVAVLTGLLFLLVDGLARLATPWQRPSLPLVLEGPPRENPSPRCRREPLAAHRLHGRRRRRPGALRPVSVILDWTPNTNHSGLYLAQARGYFADAGIDLTIVEPGDTSGLQLLAAGKADFAFSVAEGLVPAREQGAEVVSVATVIQHNTSSLISLTETGLDTAHATSPATRTGRTARSSRRRSSARSSSATAATRTPSSSRRCPATTSGSV